MTKAEQARLTAWRLRVLRAAGNEGNVARVCRRFGISRKSFYKWKRRHTDHGDAGLCDRPRTPHCSPRATARDVVSKILYLRQHYHFGAGRIAAYVRRFHQISIAVSSVHRILTRHGMPRLPAQRLAVLARARRMEVDTAIRLGTLVNAEKASAGFRALVIEARNAFRSLPNALRLQHPSLEPPILRSLATLIDRVLEGLASGQRQ